MFLEKSLVLSVILLSLVNLSNKVNGLYIQLDNGKIYFNLAFFSNILDQLSHDQLKLGFEGETF